MAAGLGSKTFTTGEVLTAADVNGYLMQGILVFASAVARDAAITSPQEGQYAYLKDTNVTYYYDGAAWIVSDATGMANPMTTTGDVIYSSSGSTPARLGIGTALQVLRTNAGATAPEWAAAAAGDVGCVAFQQAVSFAYTSGTVMILPLASELFDSGGFHDNVTNNSRITIPTGKGGVYLISGLIYLDGSVANWSYMRWYKNGAQPNGEGMSNGFLWVTTNGGGNTFQPQGTAYATLAAGDYIELSIQASTATASHNLYAQFSAILVP